MLLYLILGFALAFAAAVQPGPIQAYLVTQALSHGWRRTLPAAFSPLVSDGPIIAVCQGGQLLPPSHKCYVDGNCEEAVYGEEPRGV